MAAAPARAPTPAAAPAPRGKISAATRIYLAQRARAEMARRSLYEFLVQAWPELEPGVPFEDNWHLHAFCFHVQSMLEGWLIANGHGTQAMRDRVRASWHANGLAFTKGELLVQNLIMNLPPSTLKSRILMVVAPAWIWLHCATWSVCAISAVDDNVRRDSNAHRELVQSKWYRDTFEIRWKIKDGSKQPDGSKLAKSDAVGDWATTAGGERKSRTMLGLFTGIHADSILIDDPDDANKVHSEAKRKEIQNQWTRSIKNRVKHPERSMRIAIQQRVHIDDWTAAQINKGIWSPEDRKAWAWVVMPLEFGHAPQGAPVISPWGWRDQRRIANDNMQPTRFTPAVVADEQRDKGPEGFEAQYNQNPSSYDAGMIKRSYVRFFRIAGDAPVTRARPHGCGVRDDGTPEEALVLGRDAGSGLLDVDFITVTVDASGGSERLTASQVGILVVAGKGLQRFVLDDRSDVMGPQAQIDAVAQVLADYPAETCLVELKALGASVIETISNMVADGKIVDAAGRPRVVVVEAIKVEPGDTKESRAHAMLPAWRQGLWHVRDGAPWLYPKVIDGGRVVDAGFIGEVCAFPKSKRNDRVDALSQLDAFHRESGDELGRWRAMGRSLRR